LVDSVPTRRPSLKDEALIGRFRSIGDQWGKPDHTAYGANETQTVNVHLQSPIVPVGLPPPKWVHAPALGAVIVTNPAQWKRTIQKQVPISAKVDTGHGVNRIAHKAMCIRKIKALSNHAHST